MAKRKSLMVLAEWYDPLFEEATMMIYNMTTNEVFSLRMNSEGTEWQRAIHSFEGIPDLVGANNGTSATIFDVWVE